MADKKISALTAATLPLAGTEVLPIVQSGTTDNITVNDLAAGNLKSQSTTGVMQVSGPAAGAVRVATVPNSNWTAARTDASQTFTDTQTVASVTTTRNATTRPVVVDGGAAVPNPYEGFGVGVKYTGLDYGDAPRDYAYIDAVMSAKSSSSGGGDAGFKSKLVFSTNAGGSSGAVPTNQIEINSDGNIVILNSGKGIDFSATSGTGTSELLADYEEGTWTPAYQTSNSDITYSAGTGVNGKYTKVGNTVFFSLMIRGNITGGTGTLRITGLPYAAVTVNSAGCPCTISSNYEWTSSPGTNPTVAGSLIVLGSIGATNFAATAIGASKSGSGSYNEVTLSGSYQTS